MVSRKNIEKMNLEAALEELEKNVEEMEKTDISLEDSLALFKRGVELSQHCFKKLNLVEKEVEKIVIKNEKEFSLEKFVEDEHGV